MRIQIEGYAPTGHKVVISKKVYTDGDALEAMALVEMMGLLPEKPEISSSLDADGKNAVPMDDVSEPDTDNEVSTDDDQDVIEADDETEDDTQPVLYFATSLADSNFSKSAVEKIQAFLVDEGISEEEALEWSGRKSWNGFYKDVDRTIRELERFIYARQQGGTNNRFALGRKLNQSGRDLEPWEHPIPLEAIDF